MSEPLRQIFYVVESATGKELQTLDVPFMGAQEGFPLQEGQQLVWFNLLGEPADFTTALVEGKIVFVPRTPDIELELKLAKINRRQQVNALRDAKMNGVCMTQFGMIDLDDTVPRSSRTKLNAALTNALSAKMLNRPFSKTWTMADNSEVEFTADQFIDLNAEIDTFINACQDCARDLKAEIDIKTTPEDVNDVDIKEGWPE